MMGKIFSIQDTISNKISFYHLAVFLSLLPFDRFFSELVLISFALHTLMHAGKNEFRRILKTENLLLVGVLLISVVGLCWSHDKGQGLKDLQRQLAILLFPILLSATQLDIRFYRKKLLLIFSIVCSAVILYLYADALHIIIYNHLAFNTLVSAVFLNHNFSAPIGIHATYLSLYVALSLATILYYFPSRENKKAQTLFSIIICILIVGLLQLASRSVWITCFVFSLVFPFLLRKRGRHKQIIIIFIMLVAAIAAILTNDALKKRYVLELQEDLSSSSGVSQMDEPRLERWQFALQLVNQSPILGHGSGSEKRLLSEKYYTHRFYHSYLLQLNAHNQYLSFLIKTGFLGLLVFLIILYAGFAVAWHNRDLIFLAFMSLIIIVSFSENILDVNKGIFFYAFFFSFFIKTGKPFQELYRLVNRRSDRH